MQFFDAICFLCYDCLEKGILSFDQTLNLSPNDAYALTKKGLALNELRDYNKAIAYFDKALSIDPSFQEAIVGKDYALSQSNLNETR